METTRRSVGEAIFRSALRGEREKLRGCLEEIRRCRSWLERDLPEALRDRVEAMREEAQARLARLLIGWEDAGWVVTPVPETDLDPEARGETAEPGRPPLVGPERSEPRPGEGEVGRRVDEIGAPPGGALSDVAAGYVEPLAAPRERPGEAAGAARPGEAEAGTEDRPEARAVVEADGARGAARTGTAGAPAAAAAGPAGLETAEALPGARSSVAREDLERLAARYNRGEAIRAGREAFSAPRWPRALQWLDEELASGGPSERSAVVARFVESRLHEAGGWPRGVQKVLMGLLSSVLREAQDDHGLGNPELGRTFSRLTAFSKEHQPGFVPGLSRANSPQTGSWQGDVAHWLAEARRLYRPPGESEEGGPSREELLVAVEEAVGRWGGGAGGDPEEAVEAVRRALLGGVRSDDSRLIDLAEPLLPYLEGGRRIRSLRQKIRRRRRQRRERGDPVDSGAEWILIDELRGRRMVLAGGMPREEARQRLQSGLELADLEWPELTGPRALQDLAQRVRSGSYDFVVLLKAYASHEIERALAGACEASGTPLVRVGSGYGMGAIQRAIEQAVCQDRDVELDDFAETLA